MNVYKTRHMVVYLHQNAGRNKYVKTDDSYFEMVDEF
jgi:hypothetical protein